MNNIFIFFSTLTVSALLFSKSFRTSKSWHATVTPLASIIGSGFLVSAPLLILATGKLAPLAMGGIVIIAYALGSSIRTNISLVEPILAEQASSSYFVKGLEALSRPVLGLAYVISIAFYIKLLSAFALRGVGISSSVVENSLTTVLLLFIGVTGKLKGLSKLELLETYSVNIKLSIIVALILGHISFNFYSLFNGQWQLLVYPHEDPLTTIQKLLGMLIIIQGFETSRYLGSDYSKQIRIKTMRNAQIISGIIYVIFITSTLTAFNHVHSLGETTVIDVCRMVAPILPMLIIIAAVMSQFSAAVADTIGSGGLLVESMRNKITTKTSYLLITLTGVILTWFTNIYTIITFASKAFAIYYTMQLVLSTIVLSKQKRSGVRYLKILLYLLLIILMVAVILFGIPVKE
tara:strand:+ start:529 stop:1746 length:1218 start_codon:yes stop_codon:yes gene_type:complete